MLLPPPLVTGPQVGAPTFSTCVVVDYCLRTRCPSPFSACGQSRPPRLKPHPLSPTRVSINLSNIEIAKFWADLQKGWHVMTHGEFCEFAISSSCMVAVSRVWACHGDMRASSQCSSVPRQAGTLLRATLAAAAVVGCATHGGPLGNETVPPHLPQTPPRAASGTSPGVPVLVGCFADCGSGSLGNRDLPHNAGNLVNDTPVRLQASS
jgi:hypothetical protein